MTSIDTSFTLEPSTRTGATPPPSTRQPRKRARRTHTPVTQLSADELVERIALGDIGAVFELKERFAPPLKRIAFNIICDEREAGRAVEAAFEEACDGWPPKRGQVVHWLMRLVRRQARARARMLWGANG